MQIFSCLCDHENSGGEEAILLHVSINILHFTIVKIVRMCPVTDRGLSRLEMASDFFGREEKLLSQLSIYFGSMFGNYYRIR